MGEYGTPQNVNLGSNKAIAIAAGDYHTCALLTGGDIQCWGTMIMASWEEAPQGDDSGTPQNVNLGSNKASAIAAGGASHLCPPYGRRHPMLGVE